MVLNGGEKGAAAARGAECVWGAERVRVRVPPLRFLSIEDRLARGRGRHRLRRGPVIPWIAPRAPQQQRTRAQASNGTWRTYVHVRFEGERALVFLMGDVDDPIPRREHSATFSFVPIDPYL